MDVISVVYNRDDYTGVFLDSLYKTKHGTQVRPVIVDNGSRRRTRDVIDSWVESYQPGGDVEEPLVIATGENLGFAGGVNAALDRVDLGRPLAIMHNDTVPFDGWAGEMLACLEDADDDVAVVVPMTNYANEHGMCVRDLRDRFEAIKPLNKEKLDRESIDDLLDELYFDGRQAVLDEISGSDPRTSYSIEVASFCMLVTPEAWSESPRFDQDFFPRGYEDKFWFAPLEGRGWICVIANRAYVHHWGNITSDGPGFCFPVGMERNGELFREKMSGLDRVREAVRV